MKPRRPPQRENLQTPQQVLDTLLELVKRKFYQGEAVAFAKDRRLLLQWVLLWPAREWFTPKAVTVPAARYQEILSKVLISAAAFQTGAIKYRPAWLARVIQSHFAMHGEEIYEEAKSARTLAEHALLSLGKVPVARQDQAVEQLSAASRLLDRTKRVAKPVRKEQLSLL